ncbi:DUF5337 family protein [Tropicimonas sp.]|uniref:DUF5337 family protein n=1 Tax=Tropicimonas sp. TaxID=2067044 RepID=UPI003A8B0B5A
MNADSGKTGAYDRRKRRVALVIAAAGLLAIFGPMIAGALGLAADYDLMFYFASLAAFVWAFAAAVRMRRNPPGDDD